MMVNRGPQAVQFRNGYAYRRSSGSPSSPRQSVHVAKSGAGKRAAGFSRTLASIENEPGEDEPGENEPGESRPGEYGADSRLGVASEIVIRIGRAAGGASRRSRSRKRATVSELPSTSMSRPLHPL